MEIVGGSPYTSVMNFQQIIVYLLSVFFASFMINHLCEVLPRYQKFFSQEHSSHALLPTHTEPNNLQPHARSQRRKLLRAIFIFPLSFAFIHLLIGLPPKSFILITILYIYLATVAIIDIEHHLILDQTNLLGLILLASIGIISNGLSPTLLGATASLSLAGCVYALGLLFARWLRADQDIAEAFGLGDVILSGLLGLLLGWPDILPGLMLGCLLGGGFAILWLTYRRLIWKETAAQYMPYAPFLIAGCMIIYCTHHLP